MNPKTRFVVFLTHVCGLFSKEWLVAIWLNEWIYLMNLLRFSPPSFQFLFCKINVCLQALSCSASAHFYDRWFSRFSYFYLIAYICCLLLTKKLAKWLKISKNVSHEFSFLTLPIWIFAPKTANYIISLHVSSLKKCSSS